MFLSQDTYRGDEKSYGSWNLYAYCAGNPIKYIDPSGHWVDILVDAIGFAVDAYSFIKDPSVENGIFLAVDVAMVLLPCVTGASIVRTSIKKEGNVVTSSKYGTKTKTVRNNIKQAGKKVAARYGGKKLAKKVVKKKLSLTLKNLRGK